MRWWLMLFVALGVTLAVRTVWAQPVTFEPSPFIYRLKISDCGNHEPANRRQTGFRVNGMVGIVTALHGVADCTQIHALSDENGPIFTNLTIHAVDIDHDVALLSSAELQALPPEGLPVAEENDVQTRELRVIGYPLGLDEQDVLVDVAINYTPTLQSIIPDTNLSDAFKARNSPNLMVEVFRVQTHLVPGHSGAPLLDNEGRVVAVANGGIQDGTVEIGWAMPWYAVKPQLVPLTIADQILLDRLTKLKTQNPQLALAFSSTYPPEVEASAENSTLIGTVAGVNEKPISGAEVTLTLIDAYYVAITDDKGIYRFSLTPSTEGKFREILVESEEYQTQRLNVFDQLPTTIKLAPIRLARSVTFERDEYVRVIWPTGIALHPSPRDNSPIRTELSEGRLLQIIDGPEQQQEYRWWEVRLLGESKQTGWIVASSATDIYVERLPLFIPGDFVKVMSTTRRVLRQTPESKGTIIGSLVPGDEAKVTKGPEEVGRYLWYELQEPESKIVGWTDAVGNQGTYFELVQPLSGTSTLPTVTEEITTAAPLTVTVEKEVVHITVTGVGFAPEDQTNPALRKQFALKAARVMASANFARWKNGEDLSEVTIVNQNQGELQTDLIRTEVRAHIPGGKEISQSYDNATGEAQVTVEYIVEVPE